MIVTVVPDNFSPSVKLSRDQFDLRLIRLNSVGSHGKKKNSSGRFKGRSSATLMHYEQLNQ